MLSSTRWLTPAHLLRVAGSLFLAATWLGCGRDEPATLEPSLQELSVTRTGRILGPDGRNICRTIEEGTMLVRVLNPEFGTTPDEPGFLAEQDVTCPDNQYSVSSGNGTDHLRVELPINEHLDALPWRTLDVRGGGGFDNVVIDRGSPLGGRARLDGRPFEGVFFDVAYEFNPNFGATGGVSGPDGRWMEFFGRSPAILQTGQSYIAFSSCGATLGTRQLRGFPDEPFNFNSGRGLFCDLETAAATQFTHTFTRLAVTPFPGDIGGSLFSPHAGQYGVGYGVQFPVPRGSSPVQALIDQSHMFQGGLFVGVGPDQILSGIDVSFMQCDPTCHDLGLDGTVEFEPPGSERRAVTWRYSDAGSAERAGLRVTQRSIDGSRGNDYVLFRFVFRNTSRAPLRFHAGFVGDWDVDIDAGDDRGATAMGGRLMYQRSSDESGIHIGTMLLGNVPVTGNFFFGPDEFLSEADQLRALRGAIRRTEAGPTDLRNIHGAGPFRINPQETQDFWIAVVAGENRADLLDNAAAARADVQARLTETVAEAATNVFNPPLPIRATGRSIVRPGCKGCKPQQR